MKKVKSDSIAIGMCLGVAFAMIFDNFPLGIAIGAAIGATGVFDSKNKSKKERNKKDESE